MRGALPAFVSIARALAGVAEEVATSAPPGNSQGRGGNLGSNDACVDSDNNDNSSSTGDSDPGNISGGAPGRVHAQVAIIYIQEAHAQDEWPIDSSRNAAPGKTSVPVRYRQHADLTARLGAAADFARDYGLPLHLLPVLADGMDNAFQTAYAAWPIRWYILDTRPASGSGTGGGSGRGIKRGRIDADTAPTAVSSSSAASTGEASPQQQKRQQQQQQQQEEVYVRSIGEPDDASFDLRTPMLLLEADTRVALVYDERWLQSGAGSQAPYGGS